MSDTTNRSVPPWPGPANGLDGETGAYLVDSESLEDLLEQVRRESLSLEQAQELQLRHQRAVQGHFGLMDKVDRGKMEEAGWGVVFAADTGPEVRKALQPLLDHRRQQAGDLFRTWEYRGETALSFREEAGAGPGPVDPAQLPYYLLLVGGPESIPFEFQYQLDIAHAVGRLHFDGRERCRHYRSYAERLIAAETEDGRLPRRAVLFGTFNPNDPATGLTHDHLVQPLGRFLHDKPGPWEIAMAAGTAASKERLVRLLGREAPRLLFAALHGLGFDAGDPRQRLAQGGLVCQDWNGPGSGLSEGCYVAAGDLDSEADLTGLLAFLFACFSAGTPAHNDFAHRGPDEPATLAPRPFLAALPQKLLSQGALAVVGHVDRLWGYSFYWPRSGRQLPAFQDALGRLLEGEPVGWAMEPINLRYAELATQLLPYLLGRPWDDPRDEVALRTALLDARNYVILGDPAVRLR